MTTETRPADSTSESTSAVEKPAVGAETRRRRRRVDLISIVLFILPAFVLFVLMVLVPIIMASYYSLTKWKGYSTTEPKFVGLDNFTRLLTDEVFLGDLKHGGILILLSLVVQLPLALGLALLLNQPLRGRAVYRVLFFAPYVLAEVTTAQLFRLVLSPERGLAKDVSDLFGLGDIGSELLADPKIILYTLFFVITWKYFGFHMMILLAGRQSIPEELHEAAKVDGASTWKTFRYVTLPLLAPTIRLSIFLSIIGTIQLYDMVWVLTGGGPDRQSETMAVTMYLGFKSTEIGYANAISIVMFLMSLIFALFYQRFVLRRDLEGAVTTMGDRR